MIMKYCIYKATNLVNEKVYIGYTKDFKKRVRDHKNSALKSQKQFALYNAIRKYGWDNFKWEVLYESWDKEHCLREAEPAIVEYYDSYRSGYNMTKGGEGVHSLKIKRKPLTEEQKKIISEKTKEGMKNMDEASKNQMLERKRVASASEETRMKQSIAKKGKESSFKGKTQSAEAKMKISEAKKGKPSWNKGLKNYLSLESRLKMSEAKKKKLI